MRILTFTSLFPNACKPLHGIFVYRRVAPLGRRPGNAVQVVAPVPYFPSWLRWSRWHAMSQIPRQEQIGELTVYHPRYPLLPKLSMPLHGLLMFLGSVSLARRLHRQAPFDCIDAHYVYPDGCAAVLLGRLLKLPVVVSARGTDVNLFPSFRLIRPMIRWTLRQAAGMVAVSSALKQAMVGLGVPPAKIQIIQNGVDVEQFQPLDCAQARRRLGLPKDGRVVVSVGKLVPTKGHHLVISAIAQLRAGDPRVRLYVVGEGPYRASLKRLARELGVEDRVFLVGEKPNRELKLWYSAADVSCLASSREGMPNVVLESLACGTPVVATSVGGVPEVITSSAFGLLVDAESHAIAKALASSFNRQWDRDALAGHARTRTWDTVAAEVERCLAGRIAEEAKRIRESG